MDFAHSVKVLELRERLEDFMAELVYPNEALWFEQAEAVGPYGHAAVLDPLKVKARTAGLWNLFLPGVKGARA